MGAETTNRVKSTPKNRISISISKDVQSRLEEIGEQYGLKISHMLERAARYYLADIEDLEIAYWRYENPKGERISGEEAKRIFGVED